VSVRSEDWEILGLEPGADIGQVRRAYRHRRSLYEPAALATYNLLDDEEREGMVDRIDEAYRRIMGSNPPAAEPAPPPEPAAAPPSPDRTPIVNAPDPLAEPGAHLRYHRSALGLTLHQIAAETKIGVAILEQIENEEFDALPAPAFVRGHVHQFARELKLDDAYEFAKFYLSKMQGGESEEEGS
jgi:hypothetical protein